MVLWYSLLITTWYYDPGHRTSIFCQGQAQAWRLLVCIGIMCNRGRTDYSSWISWGTVFAHFVSPVRLVGCVRYRRSACMMNILSDLYFLYVLESWIRYGIRPWLHHLWCISDNGGGHLGRTSIRHVPGSAVSIQMSNRQTHKLPAAQSPGLRIVGMRFVGILYPYIPEEG